MQRARNNWVAAAIALALALGTLAVYLPVRHHEFLNYDDEEYVGKNEPVTRGLTINGITWAFTHSHAGNWHPLTWISHMADVQFFGLNPGPHHLVNVALHTINSVLVFAWLAGVTGARWRSAMVAALFAWHPLHVESVAWIAERKDVLSGFFWLLTLIAYCRYAARPAAWRYAVTLALFAMGLMSKPMVVTLPCVLLLLDFWPLQRWTWRNGVAGAGTNAGGSRDVETNEVPAASFGKLLREKIPFFALTVLASVVTFLAQSKGGAVVAIEKISVSNRVFNALVSYLHYLEKMFWPKNLAVIYPHPAGIPWGEIIVAAIFLAAVTALALRFAQTKPYLLTGWLWYLGTLVPVIGLVQVGSQAMADRYTYIPFIGVFIMVVWLVPEILAAMPQRESAMAIAGGGVLAGCLILTSIQVPVWHDSFKLFDHAEKAVPDNFVAQLHMAMFQVQNDRIEEAIVSYSKLVALRPDDVDVRVGYGLALMRKNRYEESVVQFRKALAQRPDQMEAHYNLGLALVAQKKSAEAIEHLEAALRLKPDQMDVRAGYADALWDLEKFPEATREYEAYLGRKPVSAVDHAQTAVALSRLGRMDEAEKQFEESLRMKPDQSVPHFNLGMIQAGKHQYPGAIAHFRKALEVETNNPDAYYQLGMALTATRDAEQAAVAFREAVRLRPDWVVALNALAWILSTHQDPQIRNGTEALQMATRANEKSTRLSAWYLSTLSAAQAEVGDFDQAVATAQRAVELVSASTNKNAVAQFQQRLGVLKNHKPLRDPTLSRPKQ